MFRLDLWCAPCSPKLNTLWMRCPVLGRSLSAWNTLTGLSPLLTSASRCNHAVRDVYMNRLLWMLWHFNFFYKILSKGVPGFSYAICRSSVLASCKGNARSLSLDLEDQVFAKLLAFLLEKAWHIFSGRQHEQDRTVPVHPTDPHPAGLQESFGGVPRRGRA